MTVDNFKDANKLEINLTQKDNVWLKDIYNEFKKAEKIETGKSLEELDLLKNNVRNEVVYIMEYGEWYLIESWDTISHINAMLPKWYSIKISNPRKLLSNSNIRVTVKNNKLLINWEIENSSSIRWGLDATAKENFDLYKASKWAKECFMSYDNEKKVFIAENGDLIIDSRNIDTLDELKQKTIEYREIKADEKAIKIAEEVGITYDEKTNMYISNNWKFMTTRDSIKDAYELKLKIIEYRETIANEQAERWANESDCIYDKVQKQYSYNNSELLIDRDKIKTLKDLKIIIADYKENLANDKAYSIADNLKDKGVLYDSEKQLYIFNWGELVCSRNSIETIEDLENKIDEFIRTKESSKKEVVVEKTKFIEYKVKKWDMLWNIIRHNFQDLWLPNNKNSSIWQYYNDNKNEIISTNNLKMDRKWNPIIRIWQNIKLPTLYIENNDASIDPLENTSTLEKTKQILDNLTKELISWKKTEANSENPWEQQVTSVEKISIKKKIEPIEQESKDVAYNLKDKIKESLLEDQQISEKNILWIDIRERKYGIQEIIVYMRLLWPIKRIFQSNKWKEDQQNIWFHELTNSKENYLFRLFLMSIQEDMTNIFINTRKKDEYNEYNIHYTINKNPETFERSFQSQEKNWEIYFEEITSEIELGKADLQRKMSDHWLNVTFMFPTSFAEKIIVDWYKTYLYKCKYREPNNKEDLIWKFYINKDWELKKFLETKKS